MDLAEIFRQYGPAYRERFGDKMPSSHKAAMKAIEQCRTEALGGQLYYCHHCDEQWYSYHSCRNRHCPKCQYEAAQVWLEKQRQLLLPVPYFLVTFTLPAELREIVRSNQQIIYNLLFRSATEALQQLAQDRIGGQIGIVGILQTWTRDLRFHPHVHFLVPGGGLSKDGKQWFASRKNFLVRVEPLGRLFRGKFRAALKKTALFANVPTSAWDKVWVVDSRPVGTGEAALKYLAPYVFRVAISNNRILKVENDSVFFSLQRGRFGEVAHGATASRGVHSSFPTTRFAKRLRESSLLWLVGSRQSPQTQTGSNALACFHSIPSYAFTRNPNLCPNHRLHHRLPTLW